MVTTTTKAICDYLFCSLNPIKPLQILRQEDYVLILPSLSHKDNRADEGFDLLGKILLYVLAL